MAARNCTITKEFRFEAAHQLPNHMGKCHDLHGHSYRVEITVQGLIKEPNGDSNEGMVMDYSELKEIVKLNLIDIVDHKFLNDVLPHTFHPTTAENIAWWIFTALAPEVLAPGRWLQSVTVWETATSQATVLDTDYNSAMYDLEQEAKPKFLGDRVPKSHLQ